MTQSELDLLGSLALMVAGELATRGEETLRRYGTLFFLSMVNLYFLSEVLQRALH